MTASPPETGPDDGPELLVIGTGINMVNHLTLECRAAIQKADRVLYIAHGWTAGMIEKLRPDAINLTIFYDEDTPRRETYEMMAQVVLAEACNNRLTVMVSYGHPGVFGFPMHRAVEIARRKGVKAHMMPGISAEDCLFADLGIDPARQGCQTYEATDFLARKRRIDTTVALVIWQPDVIADISGRFRRADYESNNVQILADVLADLYSEDHPLYIYVAADVPFAKPGIERTTIAKLPDFDLTNATLYIPPDQRVEYDKEMIQRLGLPMPGEGGAK
jgi:uncharacterized protein YabN with tetrapyrrole methylase and pyrophosphatase domain